jgi:hypothetical protein
MSETKNSSSTPTKPATRPQEPAKPKGIYDYTSEDQDCPDDIVVNASNRPIIIQAEAHEDVRKDCPRIEPGDRRRGPYYVSLISLPVGTGIQLVKKLPMKRLAELEKQRQIRTGDRAPDWVLEARARAEKGHQAPEAGNVNIARANLATAAQNW